MNDSAVNSQEICLALRQLGGTARVADIKDKVTRNRGGIPSHFSSPRSFRETIQRVIENHCPQSANYSKRALFQRVGWGVYKLM